MASKKKDHKKDKKKATKKQERKPEKLIKSDAAFQAFAARKKQERQAAKPVDDLTYYRDKLVEAYEKQKAARNEVLAVDALVKFYEDTIERLTSPG
jgi:hypothetical protein